MTKEEIQMKKRYIFLIIILLIILSIIGFPILKFFITQYAIRQEEIAVVKSDRVRTAIEKSIKKIDPKALTDEGIIKSYKIDYNSVKDKSLQGFTVTVYVNNDKEQFIVFLIDSLTSPSVAKSGFSHKLNEIFFFDE